jgi:chromosomal replication initiator protein
MLDAWPLCLERLEAELSAEDFQTWIKPLQASQQGEGLAVYAPNAFVVDTVRERYLARMIELLRHYAGLASLPVRLEVGSVPRLDLAKPPAAARAGHAAAAREDDTPSNLDPNYSFDTFVEGKSNQLGKSAVLQVAQNPGRAYNPLLLYGGTGLGKTHLMHAAGNLMRALNPGMKVLYLRSEQFITAMIRALQSKGMDQFKQQFQRIDALLIDDIQMFAGKDRTQEEFFPEFGSARAPRRLGQG